MDFLFKARTEKMTSNSRKKQKLWMAEMGQLWLLLHWKFNFKHKLAWPLFSGLDGYLCTTMLADTIEVARHPVQGSHREHNNVTTTVENWYPNNGWEPQSRALPYNTNLIIIAHVWEFPPLHVSFRELRCVWESDTYTTMTTDKSTHVLQHSKDWNLNFLVEY